MTGATSFVLYMSKWLRLPDRYQNVYQINQTSSKKLLIEIGSHLALFVHFANRKTLPFIPFDGTFEVDRYLLYRALGGELTPARLKLRSRSLCSRVCP